jgi:hypothetical protein
LFFLFSKDFSQVAAHVAQTEFVGSWDFTGAAISAWSLLKPATLIVSSAVCRHNGYSPLDTLDNRDVYNSSAQRVRYVSIVLNRFERWLDFQLLYFFKSRRKIHTLDSLFISPKHTVLHRLLHFLLDGG